MGKKPNRISGQLREFILNAPVSRYRMARDLGMSEAALSRFVNHVAGLRLSNIDDIGEYLGLRLVADKPKKRTKREV